MVAQSNRRSRRSAPRATAPSPAIRLWWRVALIAAAGALVYANSLSNPFVFDDHTTIVSNPQIRSLANVLDAEKGSALTGRPVVSVTFFLNYALHGLDVTGYRLVNIALHIGCGLLLFGAVRRTLELPGLGERFGTHAGSLALAAALVWVVHPLNTEVVDYLTQRTESMMALFFLLTMYATVRALREGRRWQVFALVSCAIGMMCKEPMATAPLMVVLYDRVFAFESLREAFRTRWRFYLGLAGTWIVVGAMVATASREFTGGYATTHVSVWSYLLNQTPIITHYLKLVVWPRELVAYYGWSLPASLREVLPYAVFVTSVFLASVVALIKWPRAGFLAMWFFVTLAPSSSVLPIAAEVGADRRMYVPLMGLVVLAAIGGHWVVQRMRQKPAVAAAAFLALIVTALGARTVARNRDYSSELRLSRTTLEHWPSAVAHDMVGLSLAAVGDHEGAVRELRQAVDEYPPARYDLAVALLATGRMNEAVAELERFVALEPNLFTTSAARTLLGRTFTAQGRVSDAIVAFQLAVTGPAPDPQAHGPLADLLLDAHRYDEAITHYRAYLAAFPERAAAMANLGIALASAHRTAEALAVFRQAVQMEPANVAARENLARMLLEAGQAQAAAAEARAAVSIAPTRPAAYDLLGQALAAERRFEDARLAFEQALRFDPNYAPAREHLRRLGR